MTHMGFVIHVQNKMHLESDISRFLVDSSRVHDKRVTCRTKCSPRNGTLWRCSLRVCGIQLIRMGFVTYVQNEMYRATDHFDDARFLVARHYPTSGRHCIALQRAATHCNALQRTASHCNTLQHTATRSLSCCTSLTDIRRTLRHSATHSNALQHTATHCNALQHAATHCNALQHTATRSLACFTSLSKILQTFSKISSLPNLLCKMTIELIFENFYLTSCVSSLQYLIDIVASWYTINRYIQ